MRPRRTDANHKAIVEQLRQRGIAVLDLHSLPGALDLLVGFRGVLSLIELKDGAKSPSRRRVTDAEQTTIARFRAVGCPVIVAATLEALLSAIGVEG